MHGREHEPVGQREEGPEYGVAQEEQQDDPLPRHVDDGVKPVAAVPADAALVKITPKRAVEGSERVAGETCPRRDLPGELASGDLGCRGFQWSGRLDVGTARGWGWGSEACRLSSGAT